MARSLACGRVARSLAPRARCGSCIDLVLKDVAAVWRFRKRRSSKEVPPLWRSFCPAPSTVKLSRVVANDLASGCVDLDHPLQLLRVERDVAVDDQIGEWRAP